MPYWKIQNGVMVGGKRLNCESGEQLGFQANF
jgi:hypothetical protein